MPGYGLRPLVAELGDGLEALPAQPGEKCRLVRIGESDEPLDKLIEVLSKLIGRNTSRR